MLRFALPALTLAACATDPVAEPGDDPDLATHQPDLAEQPGGVRTPDAHEVARDLAIRCATRLDGIEELRISVTSDRGVAFAFAQVRNGELRASLELGTIDFGDGIIVGGELVHAGEALSSGRLELDAASGLTCATLPEFGVHVTIAFETGAVACVTGGNAAQAKSFVCQ